MRMKWQVTAVAAALGLAAAGQAEASPATSLPTVEIVVLNQANLPGSLIIGAQKEAALIYARAGIRVVWGEADPDARPTSRVRLVISVTTIAPGTKPMALGFASPSHDARGSISFAFFGRIKEFARAHNADVSQVLAYVIAHEVGHQLLAFDSHSDAGVMRAVWTRTDLRPKNRELMIFNDEQAKHIRDALTLRLR